MKTLCATFFGSIALAVAAFALLAYPFLIACGIFVLARWFGASAPAHWALLFGFGSLFLLPLGMSGHALFSSLRRAQEKEGITSKQQAGAPAVVPQEGSRRPKQEVSRTIPIDFSAGHVVDAWKISIDVQQHFNDLELRIRNLAVTLLVGVMGATAFALKEHYDVVLYGRRFALAVGVLLGAILGWFAFYFTDRHWYHLTRPLKSVPV